MNAFIDNEIIQKYPSLTTFDPDKISLLLLLITSPHKKILLHRSTHPNDGLLLLYFVILCYAADDMILSANLSMLVGKQINVMVPTSDDVTLNPAEGTGKHSFLSPTCLLFILISIQLGTEEF